MPDIKLSGPDMAARINARLANSGTGRGTTPDQTVKTGDSARRVFTNIHRGGTAKQHGDGGPMKPKGRGLDERGHG